MTDIMFYSQIDHYNFQQIPQQTALAKTNILKSVYLDVINEEGEQIWQEYFFIKDKIMYTKQIITPSMLSINYQIVKQDCLCYLMEPMPHVIN